jgi:hypothetical protein
MLGYGTDGVNPWRSGFYSMWPLVVKVLNLGPQHASTTELLILAGVVHGPRKPKSLQCYQLLIADEMEGGRQGIDAISPNGKEFLA